jgi:hypothetical protein
MIQLDWSLWCSRHLEPYRERWPYGAASAMLMVFHAAIAMPAVADAAGGDAEKIEAALQRFRPICCFISKAQLDKIYAETLPRQGTPE